MVDNQINTFNKKDSVVLNQRADSTSHATTALKIYLKLIPPLIGTGPTTTVIADIKKLQLIEMTGDFERVLGLPYEKKMGIELLDDPIFPAHQLFIRSYLPENLHSIVQISDDCANPLEFSLEFKFKRLNTYYWINQRVFNFHRDDSEEIRYVIMQYADITATKTDQKASLIAYDTIQHTYLLNETADKSLGIIKRLTPTELEVVKYVAQGKSDKQIAEESYVQLDTIKQHKKHIFAKLDIHKSIELVALAYNSGLMK